MVAGAVFGLEECCHFRVIHAKLPSMKKILTTLVAVALTLPAWGALEASHAWCYFVANGKEDGTGTVCSGVKYEDGNLLVTNESFRVLAVWWDGFSSKPTDYIPFELDIRGNPVPVPGAESAEFIWMRTKNFGDGSPQTYAPMRQDTGVTGLFYKSSPLTYRFSFSLDSDAIDTLSKKYENQDYRVYFITQDTRRHDGTIPTEGVPTRLVKWNVTYLETFKYNTGYIGKPFAMNFTDSTYHSRPALSPTRSPYVEVSETDVSTDEEVDTAVAALEASLDEEVYATITKINNPAVANVIANPDIVLEDGVATFEYDLGISDLSVSRDGDATTVHVTVKLREGQSIADGATLFLIDAEGNDLDAEGGFDPDNPHIYTFTVKLKTLNAAEQGSSTLSLRAKAATSASQE